MAWGDSSSPRRAGLDLVLDGPPNDKKQLKTTYLLKKIRNFSNFLKTNEFSLFVSLFFEITFCKTDQKIKSGKKVYDWKIPSEWNAYDAYVKNKRGRKIIDFKI